MNDRNLMEGILLLEKGVCDLYMHGTLESPSDNVHRTFNEALNESLSMQDTLYEKMQEQGWYTVERANSSEIDSVRAKHQMQ